MSRVVTPVVCLLALAAAGLLFRRFVLDGGGGARGPERPPAAPASVRLPEQARRRLESAPAREAPAVYRELYAQHTATRARRELAALFQQRSEQAQKELDRESEELLDALRYRSAVDLAERYRRAWAGTTVATRAAEIVKEMRREQSDQVQARISEATQLLETDRYEAAREALRTGWELETRYRTALQEQSAALERRQKVIHILATHDMDDRVFLLAVGPPLANPSSLVAELGLVLTRADFHGLLLRSQSGPGQLGRKWLHRQAMPRGRPQVIEILVAIAAGFRAGQHRGRGVDFRRRAGVRLSIGRPRRRRLDLPPAAGDQYGRGNANRKEQISQHGPLTLGSDCLARTIDGHCIQHIRPARARQPSVGYCLRLRTIEPCEKRLHNRKQCCAGNSPRQRANGCRHRCVPCSMGSCTA